MTWDEFAKLGIGMISVTNLDGVEDIVTPNPEDADTTTYTAYNLKTQGFTDEQISLYFDKNADGSYTMKTDIEFTYYKYSFDNKQSINKQSIKISTIEELAKYSGADSRAELKEKGLTDELIDKYFGLMSNMQTGIGTYALDLSNYIKYEVSTDNNGKTILTLYRTADGNNYTRVTINSDGSYETEIVGDPDAGIKKSTGTIGTLRQLD